MTWFCTQYALPSLYNNINRLVLKSELFMSVIEITTVSFLALSAPQVLHYYDCMFAFASLTYDYVSVFLDRKVATKQGHCVLQGWGSENRLCVVLCGW